MEFFVFSTNEAKDIFGEDNNLTKPKQVSLWAKQLVQKYIKDKGFTFEPIISYSQEGKPFFLNNTSLHFSISHNNNYIAICFSEKEIGIDIENKRKAKLEIAKRFLHKKEAEYLSSISDQESLDIAFTKIWTLKEAYVKCIGTGIANTFNTFYITLEPEIEIHNSKDVQINSFYLEEQGLYVSICELENSHNIISSSIV